MGRSGILPYAPQWRDTEWQSPVSHKNPIQEFRAESVRHASSAPIRLVSLALARLLFLVWPCVITPSVPSTVGLFVFGDLGFVLQGHSNLVQTEQQAGTGERINRKLGGKTVRGRN